MASAAKKKVTVHLSDVQKAALKKMHVEDFRSADEIGFDKKVLVGLVVKKLATMTRGGGRLYFKKRV